MSLGGSGTEARPRCGWLRGLGYYASQRTLAEALPHAVLKRL